MKNKKFLIGGIVIFLAIGYLGFIGFNASATYYYTVSEFMSPDVVTHNNNVRISGDIVPGSITKPDTMTLTFSVIEGGETLPIYYQGVVPDAFEEGNEVVVEGHLDTDGVFQADTILVKCPSKYVPESEGA